MYLSLVNSNCNNKDNNNVKNLVNLDSIKKDFIIVLPDELIVKVFSHLNLATLGTIWYVSKEWKRLASDETLWKIFIYKEVAFGNDKWARVFGKDIVKDEDNIEEFSSLPLNDFIEDCKKFKSIFPEKKSKDRLMLVRLPKTLNGRLTLKSLSELAKIYFSEIHMEHRYVWSGIIDELEEKSIHKSCWVLMTKDILPGSGGKSYTEQQKIVAELTKKSLINYEIPKTLKFVACILSQYFVSNTYLFSDNSEAYMRCKDEDQDSKTLVVGFAPTSFHVSYDYGDNFMGVAVLRTF